MIGSGNAAEVPLIISMSYVWGSPPIPCGIYSDRLYVYNEGGETATYFLSKSSNLGSLTLKIASFHFYLPDAAEGDEVDRIRIFGSKSDGTITVLYDSGAGQDLDTIALHSFNPADIDCTGYEQISFYLGLICSVDAGLEISSFSASCYYS